MAHEGIVLIISIISATAFLGNTFVIYVLIRRRRTFLTKPYSIFILNLAIVDCLTAIFLVFSRFVYLPPMPVTSQVASELYCKIIWPPSMPFALGFISVYTCLFLSFERWLAVVKPQVYRSLNRRHAILAVILVWLWGAALSSSTVSRVKFDEETKKCKWSRLPIGHAEMTWIDFTTQTLLPMSTIVALYSHMYYTLKKLPNHTCERESRLRRVTFVALAACTALIAGWLPSRITFMMSKYDVISAHSPITLTCATFAFLNSCVNPFLYGIYSSKFRQEYKMAFGRLACGSLPPPRRILVVGNATNEIS
ncbi:galanin receptor type 1-like [Dendronephthya gigantea]|uniref:galanin receptor type 1-like n=1 Tax=Dendronephthya gigantea TaxID=151771 RepID=UPI00106A5765|nr:galanin receptor type 1-like [Dendronephthya gigantea]